MTSSETSASAARQFVDYLYALPQGSRALGLMRRALTSEAGRAAQVDAWVPNEASAAAYDLIAGLYSLHRASRRIIPPNFPQSVGTAFRQIISTAEANGRAMYERRLSSLLNANAGGLLDPLRHTVRLCDQRAIALDWHRLLLDVLEWDDADRHVQRRIARECWGLSTEERAELGAAAVHLDAGKIAALRAVLVEADGNQRHAAVALGKSYATVRRDVHAAGLTTWLRATYPLAVRQPKTKTKGSTEGRSK